MSEHLLFTFNTFIAIFVIIDPFAVVPIYLSLTEGYTPEALRQTRRKASKLALGILATFALTGTAIFRMFGITLPAFQIAGGILLLLLGIAQLNSSRSRVQPEEQYEGMARDDISIFPLGMPLLAGPGAISTVVLFASEAKGVASVVGLMIALVTALGASHLTLKGAPLLYKVLGRTGLNLLTRIMGVILTAVAVQFIINGLLGAFPLLKSN
jgi:multiple antibiotic resistance protein